MTRLVRLAGVTLLAAISAPLLAQAQADPARLDDFAVNVQTSDASHVEQLTPSDDRVQGSARKQDRTIATPSPAGPATAALPQISAKGLPAEQPQLSTPGASPDETRAAVSSTADSRPQPVTRLGGHDRCDPQLAGEALERCRRILELRAQEFNAPERPRLSAEQQLLAEQRSADEQQKGPTPATRLRLASRDEPDADLQSNQELAALYLARQQQQAPPETALQPEDQQAAGGDAALEQILNSLQGQAGGSAPPP